ncbi:MAG TPA: tetratricopeptide repeat protein [Casimicrobiaceae bacterium]|nr:tetratricopeptide repeat protein [Casimicrobiaceae bacterium]
MPPPATQPVAPTPPLNRTARRRRWGTRPLADRGRERESLRTVLLALASNLPRYSRSVTNFANDLVSLPAPNAT